MSSRLADNLLRALVRAVSHRRVAVGVTLLGAALGCGSSSSDGPTAPEQALPPVPALESISFQLVGAGKIAFERSGSSSGYHAIYVVDGSAASSAHAFDDTLVFGAALSPDGRRLAYTAFTNVTTGYDVYVANVDGTGAQQVTRFPDNERSPSWTPDGGKIVVAGGVGGGGALNLYSQSAVVNPLDQTQLTNFPATSTTCPTMLAGGDHRVAVSSQGGMAFACTNGEIDVSVNGTFIPTYLPARNDRRNWPNVFAPSWSPDGARIAFVQTTSDSATNYSLIRFDVKIMNANGSGVATVASVPIAAGSNAFAGGALVGLNNISLCWMPDGSRLVFNVPESQVVGHVWIARLDGSAPVQLTNAPGVWDRSVSCSR